MNHEPFERQGTGKNAALLIHGIAGSPAHFRDLVPVIPETYWVYNILLDGHNGTVEDFGKTSMAKWKAQVNDTLEALFSRHEKVVLVAHSMGTLFSIQAAIDHPDRIPYLFLLSVPTRPWVRFSTACTAISVAFGKLDSMNAQAMRGDTGIQLTPQLWKYCAWIPRMIELLAECKRIRMCIPQLTVPTQIFQSKTDELVSIRSCKDWKNHPYIKTTVLSGSGHFVYGPEDTALLQMRLEEILAKAEKQSII